MLSMPFAVLSTKTAEAHASIIDDIKADIKAPIEDIKEMKSKIDNTIDAINSVVNWFKNLKENISEMSIDLLVWSYDIITSVVLHTPVFLFDSEWFKSNTLTFTGLSIAMSMLLLVYEGFQKMFGHLWKNKRTTELSRVIKRMPLVVIGSALAPTAFHYGFKAINYLTNMILDIGKIKMTDGISTLQFNDITALEVVAFICFDLALIGMMIPIFLQNFRRWADLLMLGVITPMALSCWVFEAHEGLFKTWWANIKKSSLTQLVYAVFLLIIGTLMFGTMTPDSGMDLMIKMGVIIGCLWRMNTPPSIVRSNIDVGADIGKVWKEAGDAVMPHKKHKFLAKGIGFMKSKNPFKNKES